MFSSEVSIITITLNRPSLKEACKSVEKQTYKNWHHYVIGDGIPPLDYSHKNRTTFGFSKSLGFQEPGANMPNGTPNPLQRWALKHLELSNFVCFLDDDNKYEPFFLEKMVNALTKNRNAGISLCTVKDLRYNQIIDGYPEYPRCDNSGVLYRHSVVKAIEFPKASMQKNVIQDCEYIIKCAHLYGWVRVPEQLVVFGSADNIPPVRGRLKLLESWSLPLEAHKMIKNGDVLKGISRLKKAINLDKYDAWSIWSLAEGYLLLSKKKEFIHTLFQWYGLVKKSKAYRVHHWITFSYGVAANVLNEIDKPDKFIKLALEKVRKDLIKNKNDLYLLYSLALYIGFLGNDKKAFELYKQCMFQDRKNGFAFENALWKLTILEHFYPKNQFISAAIYQFKK